jgi:GNAT superfamily N-acetyltransferase
MQGINIVPYQKKHQPYFEQLNRQWIEAWFTMEPLDEYVLTHPEEAILQSGGAILMALYNGEVAGTVGLRIAEALSLASFDTARKLGGTKVILYSNTKNAAAILLYEKLGFKHLPVENDVYARANVKMEINLPQ